jgi:hypothetical protein
MFADLEEEVLYKGHIKEKGNEYLRLSKYGRIFSPIALRPFLF